MGWGDGVRPVNGFINTEEMGSLTPSSSVEKESPTGRLGRNTACYACVRVCWQVQEVIIGSSLMFAQAQI